MAKKNKNRQTFGNKNRKSYIKGNQGLANNKKNKIQKRSMKHLPSVVVKRESSGFSELQKIEIRDVWNLIKNGNVRDIEKYSLAVYLKSIIHDPRWKRQ